MWVGRWAVFELYSSGLRGYPLGTGLRMLGLASVARFCAS